MEEIVVLVEKVELEAVEQGVQELVKMVFQILEAVEVEVEMVLVEMVEVMVALVVQG